MVGVGVHVLELGSESCASCGRIQNVAIDREQCQRESASELLPTLGVFSPSRGESTGCLCARLRLAFAARAVCTRSLRGLAAHLSSAAAYPGPEK